MVDGFSVNDSTESVELNFIQPAELFFQVQQVLQNINIPYQSIKDEVKTITELRANCAAGIGIPEVSFEQVSSNYRLPKELTLDLNKKRQLYLSSEKYLNQQSGNQIGLQSLSEFNHFLNVGASSDTQGNIADSLFSAVPVAAEDCNEELKGFIETLYSSDSKPNVMYQSWLLHYNIIKHAHFFKRKPMVAQLLQYNYLKQHHAHLYGLLALEEALLYSKDDYNSLIADMADNDVLNEFIELGYNVHTQALEITHERLKQMFRTSIGYKKLLPWQRNMSNFMFDKGFDFKLNSGDTELNERQSIILQTIISEGYVSTKDMVEKFNCNRKTIQRDFAELTEAKLVRAIGQGSALKYGLSLKDKQNSYLQQFQTINLDDALLTAKSLRKSPPRKQKRLDDDQALSQAS